MLTELRIKNFALIEELNLTFGPGFNVLTGETGAGKSILVGAINLILGGRAASGLIRRGADEAEVQALFDAGGNQSIKAVLEEMGLEPEEDVLIRRVLSQSGRNRIYINGNMATLGQLSALGRELMAVSGQHEHQQLLDPDRQLLIVDEFGQLLPWRSRMEEAHAEMNARNSEAVQLEKQLHQAREQADLYEYQVQEINAAGLTPGEDEQLEEERSLARNAEKIYSLIKASYDRLYDDSGAVLEGLDAVRNDIQSAADMDHRISSSVEQVEDAFHQLDDVANYLRGYLGQINFDPERLAEIDDRLVVINRLKRKYGPNLDDVLAYGREVSGSLERQEEMQVRLEDLRAEAARAREQAVALAGELGEQRRAKAGELAARLEGELRSLGMPRLKFQIKITSGSNGDKPGPLGWDEVEFMIAPNLGEELMPLSKIASGGELSRTMLGLKSLLAGQYKVPTIIFDEVDTGIGGAVAEVVGQKIKGLARFHQVLCITHLPQIAAFGQHHYHVYKEVRDRRTATGIKQLSRDEKLEEIARMLGGARLSEKTMAAALEMVTRAGGESGL